MNQDNSNKTPANLKGVRKALDRPLEIPRIIVIDSCTRIQRSWFEHQPKEVDSAVEIRQKSKPAINIRRQKQKSFIVTIAKFESIIACSN